MKSMEMQFVNFCGDSKFDDLTTFELSLYLLPFFRKCAQIAYLTRTSRLALSLLKENSFSRKLT